MSSLPEDTHWAVTEFAEADLGDVRRTHRLVALASVLAQHPPAAWHCQLIEGLASNLLSMP